MKYTPIIGLEVHVELKTKSKMFCGCTADYFGKEPNTHTCPVCLGLPGALPVPNKLAIEWCIKIALALNCEINLFSKFDRKNYFYPDLAKGYQISQYDLPFGKSGFIELANKKRIGITRVHMEEDTGKLIHQLSTNNSELITNNQDKFSFIDFNRSGVPLVEIVTEPDFNDALEVKEYLQKLQQIVRFLGVSDADMEKGEMRLEPNISLYRHPEEATTSIGSQTKDSIATLQHDMKLPPYKVEVKNINSFKFVGKAINYEVKRHTEILEEGKNPVQETRGWDENRQKTFSQRLKEDAQEYRYFPEPDIPPIIHTKEQISKIKSSLPELQDEKIKRFVGQYKLSEYDAEILARDKSLADYFEEAVSLCHPELVSRSKNKEKMPKLIRHDINPKTIANWIINKKTDVDTILPATLIKQILASKQTVQIDEKELDKIIDVVIKENEKAVQEYKSGKENAIMYLLGQTMKKLKEKVNANKIKEALIKKLK